MNRYASVQQATGNLLLAALPLDELDRLLPALEIVRLNLRDVLSHPGERIPFVFFPTRCAIATVVPLSGHETAEAGMTGREGMVCLSIFLECDTTPFRVVVQNAGEALRMSIADFQTAVHHSATLNTILHRYTDAFLTQVSYSTACNSLHTIEQRCSRWLLMTHDRVAPDHFTLTQDFLAQMLGVQRTSVTQVAHNLREKGLIQYSRGKVTVLDRPGLEAVACECYRHIKGKFAALASSTKASL